MADAPEPDDVEMAHAVALARLILDRRRERAGAAQPEPDAHRAAARAGINDFGGISPVTPDYINPAPSVAAPRALARGVRARGLRAAAAPADLRRATSTRRAFSTPALRAARRGARGSGSARFARCDARCSAPSAQLGACGMSGARDELATLRSTRCSSVSRDVRAILERCLAGRAARRSRTRVRLCSVRGADLHALIADRRPAAPRASRRRRHLRRQPQHQLHERVREGLQVLRVLAHDRSEEGYYLDADEIVRRALEAQELRRDRGLHPGGPAAATRSRRCTSTCCAR